MPGSPPRRGPSEQVRGQGRAPSSTSMEGGCVRTTRPAGSQREGCRPRGGWWLAGGEQAGGRPPVPVGRQPMAPSRPPLPGCPPRADSKCLSQRQTGFLSPTSSGATLQAREPPAPRRPPWSPCGVRGRKPGPCVGVESADLQAGQPHKGRGTVAPEVPSAVWLLGVQGTSCRIGHGVGGLLRPRL